MRSISVYSILGFVLTFLVAFFLATNLTSYQNPGQINEIREVMLEDLENRMESMENIEGSSELLTKYIASIEYSLTELKFKKASLYRFIGFIVVLFGVFVLRRKRSIGLHLFIGGMLFVIITGFYVYGLGIVGWALNFGYILFTFIVGLYYYSKRSTLT